MPGLLAGAVRRRLRGKQSAPYPCSGSPVSFHTHEHGMAVSHRLGSGNMDIEGLRQIVLDEWDQGIK
jgi:hypothetical protein